MKKLILLLSLVFISFQVNAGILIEPYFGTAINSSVDDTNDEGEYASATAYGARLGYQNLGLQLGIDWRNFTAEIDMDSQNDDIEYTHNPIYAFIGYEFPVMFRIYAGFAISGEGSGELGNNEADYTEMSSNYIGLSYTGLPFIALNFEMVNWGWDTEDFGNNENDSDFEGSHYLLSVSLPLNL